MPGFGSSGNHGQYGLHSPVSEGYSMTSLVFAVLRLHLQAMGLGGG